MAEARQLPAEVIESMTASPILKRFETLAEYVGAGRKLTAAGFLTMADARVLVPLLELDDKIDPTFGDVATVTRSSGDLEDLTLTTFWAKRSGAVRKVHGKLVATKGWPKMALDERFCPPSRGHCRCRAFERTVRGRRRPPLGHR